MRTIVLFLLTFVCLSVNAAWLKGNIHTHTLESDGDSPPADVVRWYAEHGYDFLVITDHDKITRVEDSHGMVMILGEEVTDRLPKKPLHVNAIGIEKAVLPQKGATPVEVLQNNIDAVRKAGALALINHPNFGWAFGADELLKLERANFLEIASGHPFVNSDGPPSVESMWDRMLTAGKKIYGVAVDDMHHLKRVFDSDVVLPGKAWVVVRAEERDAKSILAALARGDFYASNGVELEELTIAEKSMTVKVREKNLARYRIQFIGSGGRVLQESAGLIATYAIRGDEGYVRAKVIDSNGRAAWG
ncbi:MAG TPA: CehA/McbA family metallohydrolase [Thermoanaerobaculia bacterium]|nr:CehA/McbA family metallohydrolase [Thermoanaerobaculia bacterium]